MATKQIANSNLFANSYISQDWNGGYKLEVDLSSKFDVKDWSLNFKLPESSKIRGAYGIDLTENGNGNYTISGQGNYADLEPGEQTKAIFIIDESSQAKVPQFIAPASNSNGNSNTTSNGNSTSNKTSQSPQVNTNATVVEDWRGGYKLEVDLSTKTNASNWALDFNLPDGYSIRGAYGIELTDNGNNNYSISGQGNYADLEPSEQAKAIFIIDDSGKDAITPQFTASGNGNNLMGATVSDPISAPVPAPSPAPAPKPTPSQPRQLSDSAISVGFEGHSHNTSYDYNAQSKDWKVEWTYQVDKFGTISNQDARSGNNSLRMTYPANEQSNAGSRWMIPSSNEYYLSYWVKFDNDFDFDGDRHSGGKLPGLGAGELASGGKKPNGDNGFTSRYMWRENGQAVLYLYHMDQPGIYGEDILLKGNGGGNKYFERGKWHNMIQRVKVNDGSQSNGEIDVWMDGEQVLSVDNLKFMTNGQGIDTAYFSTFHGGYGQDWWPEKNDHAFFDDFVVSTNAQDVGL